MLHENCHCNQLELKEKNKKKRDDELNILGRTIQIIAGKTTDRSQWRRMVMNHGKSSYLERAFGTRKIYIRRASNMVLSTLNGKSQ